MTKVWALQFLAVTSLWFVAAPAHACPPQLPDGIVSVDTFSKAELQQKLEDGYTPEIGWQEAYSEFVDVDAYVPDLTVEETYSYLQDTYNLPEWTMSVWNVQAMGTLNGRNRFSFNEQLPPGGQLYLLEQKYPEVHTMEWWVGHAPEDIWMHYYIRILDAQLYMGKPGIIIDWVNFGHANFERNPDLMQGFLQMKVAHGIERDNMIKILQWRHAGHTGPIDDATALQLGLINGHLYNAMDIWMMLGAGVTPTVPWSTLYGGFISSHFYLVDQPVDKVWDYLKNPKHMNQWTVSTRNVVDIPGDDFIAVEKLDPRGVVFADQDLSEPSRTMDWRMSSARYHHKFGNTKWMNSSVRVVDGPESVGKPGSVVVWTTYHHVAYDALPELGEVWRLLPVKNKLAANNVSLLLGAMP